jgi:hypothetical protein
MLIGSALIFLPSPRNVFTGGQFFDARNFSAATTASWVMLSSLNPVHLRRPLATSVERGLGGEVMSGIAYLNDSLVQNCPPINRYVGEGKAIPRRTLLLGSRGLQG